MKKRLLDPGFFLNEELAECDPLARLLFAGLTLYCDRGGKFEWRPKRIKAAIFPYDISCDIVNLLGQLEATHFIAQYNVNGKDYGIIPKYLKHQSPHHREKASKIPDPPHDMKLHETPRNSTERPEIPLPTNTITNKTYTPKFENLWGHYPRKIEKKLAFKKYKATLKKGTNEEDLLKATLNYEKAMAGKEQQHIKHGATFFGSNEPWKEWVDGIPEGYAGYVPPRPARDPHIDKRCKRCQSWWSTMERNEEGLCEHCAEAVSPS